jgi:uncharacterized protein YkwD
MPKLFYFQRNLAIASILVLSACGGGEPNESEESAAFELLNSERTRCGFGTLAQNAQLEAAARGHADYQALHDIFTHEQDFSLFPQGFTGVRPMDRVTAAGYANAGAVADETVRFSGTVQKAGLGSRAVRDLLGAPYHLRGLMGDYRDVGIAVRSSSDVGSTARRVIVQINAAYTRTRGPQLAAQDAVRTYPCEGTANVNWRLRNETPDPIPGRDLAVQPLGPVIYLSGRQGAVIAISGSSMVEEATGRSIPLRPAVTADNDPYRFCEVGCFQPHEAYLAADTPVQPNMRYRVTLEGSSGGVAFRRQFDFVTGTGG